MAKDPVVQVGDEILRQKAEPVAKGYIGSPAVRKVIHTMKDTLEREEFGVAIAAPQVGSALRIFVIAGRAFDTEAQKDDKGTPQADRAEDMSDFSAEKSRA